MKLFGEYLVEQNLVSQEQLVEALIRQMKSIPSIAEVVWQKQILPSSDMLRVFKLQNINKIGFIEASQNLGVWSKTLTSRIEEIIDSTKIPLGEILVDLKYISLNQMTHALDEFLAEVESSSPSDAVVGLNVKLFTQQFNQEMKMKLEATTQSFEAGGFEEAELKLMKEHLHLLKGVSRLAHDDLSSVFLEKIEGFIAEMLKFDCGLLPQDVQVKIKNILKDSVSTLWDLRAYYESTLESQTSLETLKSGTGKLAEKLDYLADGLELSRFDLSFLTPRKGA